MLEGIALSRNIASFAVMCFVSLAWLAPAAAAESNPFVGSWVLDASRSKFDEGPVPKAETRTYAISQVAGALTIVVEGVGPDGAAYAYGASGDLDGKTYPIAGRDEGARILGDAISWKRIDPNTVEMAVKKKGDVLDTVRHSVSEDGKTLTVTENGVGPEGMPAHATMVYYKN
jgi:hypothetical protein